MELRDLCIFQIRFFSFLIGTEATDFMEVEWMACYNNGYMVHIPNLADVQSKVQVRVAGDWLWPG